LAGAALRHAAAAVTPLYSGLTIYKIGFSNDPERRLGELNAYFPHLPALGWVHDRAQWHRDEINAWAMEQQVFRELQRRGARHIKGEIYAAHGDVKEAAFNAAMRGTERPSGDISIANGERAEAEVRSE
jgi:hypothetical protein